MRRAAVVGIIAMGCVGACGGTGDDTADGSTDATTSDQESDAKLDTGSSVDTGAHDVAADNAIDVIEESPQDGGNVPEASVDAPIDSPPDVVTTDGGGCTSNSDCSTKDYCEKGNGNCGGSGTCMVRPTACPLIVAPVCGCNKTTYTNSCFCHAAGETEDYAGACE